MKLKTIFLLHLCNNSYFLLTKIYLDISHELFVFKGFHKILVASSGINVIYFGQN